MLACALAAPAAAQDAARPESKAAAKTGGRSMLYVYREKTFIGIANWEIPYLHLDGRPVTRIKIGGHMAIPVSPGTHTLKTTESLFGKDTGKVRGQTKITVRGGSTVYLRYSESISSFVPIIIPGVVSIVHMGFKMGFEPVPNEQGKSELANTSALERLK